MTIDIPTAPALDGYPNFPADSLVIGGQIELVGPPGGTPSILPACAGAVFVLDDTTGTYSLGAPLPVVILNASLVTDGERPLGRRASNRVVVLPIAILAQSRTQLAAARETLMQLTNSQQWVLTWTRSGGTPINFDCFRAEQADPVYSINEENQYVCEITITAEALPYGRSSIPDVLSFPSATVGAPPPPAPVTLDSFSVLEAGNTATWTLTSQYVTAPFSCCCFGPAPSNWWQQYSVSYTTPFYSTTFTAVNITGLNALSCWIGFASPNYCYNWPNQQNRIQFNVTLVDSGGHTLYMGKSQTCSQSNSNGNPKWQQVNFSIPSNVGSFDLTHVTGFNLSMSNQSDGNLHWTNVFIDSLVATSTSAPVLPSARGVVYWLNPIKGTSHAPLNVVAQQAASLTLISVVQIIAPGVAWTCPAGVFNVNLELGGAAGAGGSLVAIGAAASGGSPGYSCEPNLAVTPGKKYTPFIPAGGIAGGANPLPATFQGDTVLVQANSGTNAVGNTPGAAGAASTNTIAFAGAAGTVGIAGAHGGGSPSPATASGAGIAAVAGAAGTAQTNGVAGVAGPTATGNGLNGLAPLGTAIPSGGGSAGSGSLRTTTGTSTGGTGGQAWCSINYSFALPNFKTLVLHRPGLDGSTTLQPYVQCSSGVTPTLDPIVGLQPNVPARFSGTYSIVVVASSWNLPANPRTVTVTVYEWEYLGAATYGGVSSCFKTLTPNLGLIGGAVNGMVTIGELTLPNKDIAPDNTGAYYTIGITDTNGSDTFEDILLIDTMGQTIWINEPTLSYAQYFHDEPSSDKDFGRLMGTAYDRNAAVSVLDQSFISGGPLTVEPGANILMAYSVEGAPALVCSSVPRWMIDSLE